MNSSDTSEASKTSRFQQMPSAPNSTKPQSSDDSGGRQTSKSSKESTNSGKSEPQPKVTVLEQLSFKKLPSTINTPCTVEELHKGTVTPFNSTAPTVITAVLRDLQDDIVHSPDYRQTGSIALVNGERTIAVIGRENIYVQNKTKFVSVPREKALSDQQDQHFWAHQADRFEEYSPLDTAIMVQKLFIPLSSVCFGLLGGVALLQIILVHHLVGDLSVQDQNFFLQSYSKLAQLTPLLFYILLAVCIISVLDRLTSEGDFSVWHTSWIIGAVYMITLLLSLTCASYDDMLHLSRFNQTLFHNEMKTQAILSDWQLLNSLRCVFAIFGWVLFSLKTPQDNLLQYLLQIKTYKQEKQSTTTSIRDSLCV